MGVVTSITSFGRNGLADWLLQRVTAIVLAAYTVFIVGFLILNPGLEYAQWVDLHSHFCMKVFNVLAIISIAVHAWIGCWSVLTDYVTVRMMGSKATFIRLFLELGMIAVVIVYVIWALDILWGI